MQVSGTARLMAAALGLGFAIGGCSRDEGPALATVGEQRILAEDFEAFIETLPPHMQTRARTPSGRRQILEHRIRESLIEQEARSRGLHERPDVRAEIEQATQRILLKELTRSLQREAVVSDEEARSYYDEQRERFRRPERYRAQHILFKLDPGATPQESQEAYQKATAAHRRVAAGENFDQVARELSEGPNADRGGDLGYAEIGRYDPAFERAALALPKEGISEPVKTRFGWHVIRLIDRADSEEADFSSVRDDIKKQLLPRKRQESFEEFMAALRDRYRVEINEDLLMQIGPQPTRHAVDPAAAAPVDAETGADAGAESADAVTDGESGASDPR